MKKRLGFREWQWKYGKNFSDREDEIAWRKYYFRPSKTTGTVRLPQRLLKEVSK